MSTETQMYSDALKLAEDTPQDGMGPGFLVYRLAQDFHALCCAAGPEQARREMAEIIETEFERSARRG